MGDQRFHQARMLAEHPTVRETPLVHGKTVTIIIAYTVHIISGKKTENKVKLSPRINLRYSVGNEYSSPTPFWRLILGDDITLSSEKLFH